MARNKEKESICTNPFAQIHLHKTRIHFHNSVQSMYVELSFAIEKLRTMKVFLSVGTIYLYTISIEVRYITFQTKNRFRFYINVRWIFSRTLTTQQCRR